MCSGWASVSGTRAWAFAAAGVSVVAFAVLPIDWRRKAGEDALARAANAGSATCEQHGETPERLQELAREMALVAAESESSQTG